MEASAIKKTDWPSRRGINRIINARIQSIFYSDAKNKASRISGKIVQAECRKLVQPFVKLVKFHEQYRSRHGYRRAGLAITSLYDRFFKQYDLLFQRHACAPYFEEILETWDRVLIFQKERAKVLHNIGLYSIIYQLRQDTIKYYNHYKADRVGTRRLFSNDREAKAYKILQEIASRDGLDAIVARYCLKNPELIEEYIYKCKEYAKDKRQQALWGKELIRMILTY